MKGSISLEMVLLIVLMLVAVFIIGSTLISTTQNTTAKIEEKSNKIASKIDEYCITDSDCESGTCVSGKCK